MCCSMARVQAGRGHRAGWLQSRFRPELNYRCGQCLRAEALSSHGVSPTPSPVRCCCHPSASSPARRGERGRTPAPGRAERAAERGPPGSQAGPPGSAGPAGGGVASCWAEAQGGYRRKHGEVRAPRLLGQDVPARRGAAGPGGERGGAPQRRGAAGPGSSRRVRGC